MHKNLTFINGKLIKLKQNEATYIILRTLKHSLAVMLEK